MPAAPATQPRPTSGTRRTSGRSPTTAAIRASSEGIGEPGDGGADDQVDVAGREVGGLERVLSARAPSVDGVLDEQVVGLLEALELGVLARAAAPGARNSTPALAWKRAQHALVEPPPRRDDRGEGVGDLGLGVAVRRQRAAHARRSPWSRLTSPGASLTARPARQPDGEAGRDAPVAESELDQGVEGVAGRERRRRCRPRRRRDGASAGPRSRCGAGAGRAAAAPRPGAGRRPRSHRPVAAATGGGAAGRARRWRRRSRCPRRSSGSPARRRRRRAAPGPSGWSRPPAEPRQREVVAAPVARRPGPQPGSRRSSCCRSSSREGSSPARGRARRSRRCDQPSPRSKAQAYDGCRRSP